MIKFYYYKMACMKLHDYSCMTETEEYKALLILLAQLKAFLHWIKAINCLPNSLKISNCQKTGMT